MISGKLSVTIGMIASSSGFGMGVSSSYILIKNGLGIDSTIIVSLFFASIILILFGLGIIIFGANGYEIPKLKFTKYKSKLGDAN